MPSARNFSISPKKHAAEDGAGNIADAADHHRHNAFDGRTLMAGIVMLCKH